MENVWLKEGKNGLEKLERKQRTEMDDRQANYASFEQLFLKRGPTA